MRIVSLIAAVSALALGACNESRAQEAGPTVQRNYQVAGFNSIEVAGPYEVDVRTGAAPSVSASGPQRLIDELVVKVEGDILKIEPRKGRKFNWDSDEGSARVVVTAQMLRAAAIAGSGGITVDRITGDRFEGSIAGSGDLRLKSVEVGSLKFAVAGSGDIQASGGRAQNADYSIAGSGGIDTMAVRTETASVSIAGSGTVNGHTSGTADVSIMGSGHVTLVGGAQCSVSRMGSGNANCS